MARVTGRDIKRLRAVAVVLARACIFGDNVLLQSSPSGKGYATCQLEPEKLAEIRVMCSRGHATYQTMSLRQSGRNAVLASARCAKIYGAAGWQQTL